MKIMQGAMPTYAETPERERLGQRKGYMSCRMMRNDQTPRYDPTPFLVGRNKTQKNQSHILITTHPKRRHSHIKLNSFLE